MTKREAFWYTVIILLLVITVLIALMVGATPLTLSQVWQAFSGHDSNNLATLSQIRLPRIVASLISGAMLAVAGALSQAAFHNYLADPSILGVTNVGSFLILIASFFLPSLYFGKLVFALIGGILTLLFLTSRSILQHSYKLIIIGVTISLTFSGFQQLFSGESLVSTNSFNGITWSDTITVFIIGLIGLAAAILLSPWANYLKMSNQQLETRGISARLIRICLLGLVVWLSSGVTAAVGVVPFIGIIVPNIVRFLVGRDYQTIVPLSMLMGAWLLLVADTIGRTVILPGEMPVATILTVVGGPFLILLLWRQQFNAIK